MFSAFDLTRLLLAAAFIFAVVPYFAYSRNLVRGFVHAAFFLQLVGMVLGDWKLFLPGSAIALYAIWAAISTLITRRNYAIQPSQWIARGIGWMEDRPSLIEPRLAAVRDFTSSPLIAAVAVIATAVALRSAWFALHYVRLQKIDSYSRAISLHTLMRGDLWNHDAGVVLLAPIAWLSGLTPDQTIRFSGALVSVLMIAAMAFTGWRRLRNPAGAVTTSAIFAALLIGLNLIPLEPAGPEWSTVFMILAAGLAGEAWGTAALSVVTGLLIYWGLSPILLIAALALTLASLLPALAGRFPAFAALAVLLTAILLPHRAMVTEHQYEAAARAAHRIASEFRTNDWIVVSPGLEVAQTYGRGWHVELADFVNAHSEADVARADFRFPYAAPTVFVFVEKRVLNQPAFSFAHDAGSAPYYYSTRLGRASLEFRAARLMATYGATHRDSTIYYEDDDMIIYRINQSPAPVSTASL